MANYVSMMEGTICWRCGNACNNGCEWSEEGKPVPGWVADANEATGSYNVISCPKYEKNDKLKVMDTEGLQNLTAAIVKQAVADYEKGSAEEAIDVERFVKGKYFQALTSIDPSRLLELMSARRKARLSAMLRQKP